MQEFQEDENYKRIIKIQKLSNLVGCAKKFEASKIELLLFVVNIVLIILCIMNILIVQWKGYDKSIYTLRIFILVFYLFSLVCLCYNKIFRKAKKLHIGIIYYIAFYCSIINVGLAAINFLFLLITLIISANKIKKSKEKKYIYNSILVIDIFSLLIIIAKFFLWYSEFLRIYAKTNDSLKEFIDAKITYYQTQNQKIVNVELSEKVPNSNNKNHFQKVNNKSIENETMNDNKMEIDTEKEMREKNKDKKEEKEDTFSLDTK